MDTGTIVIIILVASNIGGLAYGYGRLTQKTADLCRRVDRLENILNHWSSQQSKKGESR